MKRTRTPVRAPLDHEERYPGASKLATECVMNLIRTEGLVSAALAPVLRRHGLSVGSFNVLMILAAADGPLCPSDIGENLLVTRGTVTGLLDSLEKKGLVERKPHPEDRRMIRVLATKKGRDLLDELLPEFFPTEAEVMSGLSAKEKQTLVKLLGKVASHLADQEASPQR